MASPTSTSDAICGIWIAKDKEAGKHISQYIRDNLNQEIVKADLENLSLLQEDNKYNRYVVLLSRHSVKDHTFMVFLTPILYQLHYLKLISKVVLVVIDKKFQEEKHLPINLHSYDRVIAIAEKGKFQENDLQEICIQLSEQPQRIKDVLPIGNVGIGLAWSYFYGYLNLILPGINERIKNSDLYKSNPERMSTDFFIIIPESCKTPTQFSEVDKRFRTEGPLDEGIKKNRAGQPERLYKNFVHRIEGNNQEEYRYFCGEFATPVLSLQKMLEEKTIDEREMEKQMVLFRHSLMRIISFKRNPDCVGKAVVVSYADSSEDHSLATKIHEKICQQKENEPMKVTDSESASSSSGSWSRTPATSISSIGSFVLIPILGIISGKDEVGKQWEKSITEFCSADLTLAVREYDFENLNPKLVKPTLVDLDERRNEETASDKLLIILSEDFKSEVEKHADELIKHPIWFPRTTFIVELENIPNWLEKSGVDYIDARKNNIWRRIFGSLFGTCAVEGEKDERWKKNTEGIQYQADRLPIGLVAEGLAWSYYLNYLELLGPTMAERIKETEYFSKGIMPSKLFILLPYSCFSYPKLADADPTIEGKGNLRTLVKQIAGNYRNYDNTIHEIKTNGESYYACVEYCTPVLVMYEMEAEGKAGLTHMQKEAQLHIFQRVLQDILKKSQYRDDIQLICYEDRPPNAQSLPEVLLKNIKRWL